MRLPTGAHGVASAEEEEGISETKDRAPNIRYLVVRASNISQLVHVETNNEHACLPF
jgi:hypothetical protein